MRSVVRVHLSPLDNVHRGAKVHLSPLGMNEYPKQKKTEDGDIAQLGEHLPCKQGVESSNLFISTYSKIEDMIMRLKRKILL